MPPSQEHLEMVAKARANQKAWDDARSAAFQPTRPMDSDTYWASKAAAERSVKPPVVTPPDWAAIYAPTYEAVAKAEKERTTPTPAQIKESMLTWQERARRATWSRVNNMPWPESE